MPPVGVYLNYHQQPINSSDLWTDSENRKGTLKKF